MIPNCFQYSSIWVQFFRPPCNHIQLCKLLGFWFGTTISQIKILLQQKCSIKSFLLQSLSWHYLKLWLSNSTKNLHSTYLTIKILKFEFSGNDWLEVEQIVQCLVFGDVWEVQTLVFDQNWMFGHAQTSVLKILKKLSSFLIRWFI